MSVSPQSLAKTRDKRSLKIPARFDDFREVPLETALPKSRSSNASLSRSSKANANSAAASVVQPATVATQTKSTNSAAAAAASTKPMTPVAPAKPAASLASVKPTTSSASAKPAVSLASVKPTTSSAPAKPTTSAPQTKQRTSEASAKLATDAIPPAKPNIPTPATTPVAASADANASPAPDTKATTTETRPTSRKSSSKPSSTKRRGARCRCCRCHNIYWGGETHICPVFPPKHLDDPKCLSDDGDKPDTPVTQPLVENKNKRKHEEPIEETKHTLEISELARNSYQSLATVKKDATVPSLSIGTKVIRSTEPLVEYNPNSQTIVRLAPKGSSTLCSPSTKKRANGFSLIKPNNETQPANQRIQQQVQNPAKYFNSPTQNLGHYTGPTRLMLNEPVYLPRGVAPIAPIRTTLQQIATLAREPPFISKRTAAYIAYQEERKMNYLTSIHDALIKVTRYLSVNDRLNLRCVNKTWKSIIDNQFVWKSILVNENDSSLSLSDIKKITSRQRVTEITFDEWYPENIGHQDKMKVELASFIQDAEQINIRSVDALQNLFALNLVDVCRERVSQDAKDHITLCWQIKINVDDCGIALMEVAGRDGNGEETSMGELYDFEKKLDETSIPNMIVEIKAI